MTRMNTRGYARTAAWLTVMMVLSACNSMPSRFVVLDNDKDGIADAVDACLRTALGNPVDENGCALFRGSIEAVAFEPGNHQLDSTSRSSLAELVAMLNEHPEVVLQLEGHTDNRGPAKANLALSKRRVMSVVRYLVSNGVDGNRLKPLGFGENRPIKSNATATGRSENRRIEMSVVTQ